MTENIDQLVNLLLMNLLCNCHQLSEECVSYHGTQPSGNHQQGWRTLVELVSERVCKATALAPREEGSLHSFSELCSFSVTWKKLHEMIYLKIICKCKAVDKCTRKFKYIVIITKMIGSHFRLHLKIRRCLSARSTSEQLPAEAQRLLESTDNNLSGFPSSLPLSILS